MSWLTSQQLLKTSWSNVSGNKCCIILIKPLNTPVSCIQIILIIVKPSTGLILDRLWLSVRVKCPKHSFTVICFFLAGVSSSQPALILHPEFMGNKATEGRAGWDWCLLFYLPDLDKLESPDHVRDPGLAWWWLITSNSFCPGLNTTKVTQTGADSQVFAVLLRQNPVMRPSRVMRTICHDNTKQNGSELHQTIIAPSEVFFRV